MTIEDETTVDAPAERVFGLVVDLARAPEWQGSVEQVELEGDDEVRVGTRGREVRRFAGRRSEGRFEVVELVPNERLAISSSGGGVDGTARFRLAPRNGETTVRLSLELRIGGPLRFLAGAARGRIEREVASDLERLKRLAEGTG